MKNETPRQHDFSNGRYCSHCIALLNSTESTEICATWAERQASKFANSTGPRPTQAQVDASMREAGFEASGNAAGLANQIWRTNGGNF